MAGLWRSIESGNIITIEIVIFPGQAEEIVDGAPVKLWQTI
jgi:hypothetical protein